MRISSVPESSFGRRSSAFVFGRLASWRSLALIAVVLSTAALWFGWPWLVVAGVAPLLVALAPCLLMCGAMCALKLCMKPAQTRQAVSLSQSAGPLDAADAPRPSKSCAACD